MQTPVVEPFQRTIQFLIALTGASKGLLLLAGVVCAIKLAKTPNYSESMCMKIYTERSQAREKQQQPACYSLMPCFNSDKS